MRFVRGLAFLTILLTVWLSTSASSNTFAAEEGEYEVHEWAVWFAAPDFERINSKEHFPNAMPAAAKTTRTGKAARGQPRSGPVHVMTFYGSAVKELDVGIKLDGGRYVAHWPPASIRQSRLRWRELELTRAKKDGERLPFIGRQHWAHQVREFDSLYLRTGSRVEKFLAYDVEMRIAVPFKLEGGPDRYRLFNGTADPLYDMVVSLPVTGGRRIGWLKELPSRTSEEVPEEPELMRLAATDVLDGDVDEVLSLAVTPLGGIVAIGGADGTVALRKVMDGRRITTFSAHDGAVRGLAFSHDGRFLGTGGDDHLAKMWHSPSAKLMHTCEGHEGAVLAVAFTQFNDCFATGGHDNKLGVWWVNNGKLRAMRPGHRGEIRSLDSTAKVDKLASASADRTARLWLAKGTNTGVYLGTFKGHFGAVNAVALSPDGLLIASGGEDRKVKFWDSRTRKEQGTLLLDGELVAVDFSPDGQWLITATRGSTEATVWSVSTRKPKAVFAGHTAEITSVAFVPATGLVATGSLDGTARLWNISSEVLNPKSIYRGAGHEVVMSEVLSNGSDQLAAEGVSQLREMLLANGLTEQEAALIVSEYGPAVFGSKELVVLCRLPSQVLDERVPLDLFPEPAKTVRVGLLVVRNIDPQIKNEALELVDRLGDPDFAVREAAEKRLAELGRLAVPALKRALGHEDLEVIFRAERLLLRLGETLDGQARRRANQTIIRDAGVLVAPAAVTR